MAISVTKTKQVQAPKVAALPKIDFDNLANLELEALADAYGVLGDQHRALMESPVIPQFEAVRKALLGRLNEQFEPLEELEITGEHYRLEVGAAAKTPASIADMERLRQFMGDKVFMDCAKVTLSDARAYLTPEQLEAVLSQGTKYTNRRDIKAKYLG